MIKCCENAEKKVEKGKGKGKGKEKKKAPLRSSTPRTSLGSKGTLTTWKSSYKIAAFLIMILVSLEECNRSLFWW